ncbi:MAG: YigZ family protein [Bacteroidota bacterium]
MYPSKDIYKTIAHPSDEVLFKERKSKFFGYAFPIDTEAAVKPILDTLKRRFPAANHFCYAWQIGIERKKYRANDDGEPKNSAGMPIYGQIQSFELTNILVVVVRIFGGAKLGVSGLINAYRTTAHRALKTAIMESKVMETKMLLYFDYSILNKVMRVLKKWNVRIVSQQMEAMCSFIIALPKSKTDAIHTELKKIHPLKITHY